MKIVEPSAILIWVTPAPELNIEIAGRTCYKSEPKVFKDCEHCKGTGTFFERLKTANRPEVSIQPEYMDVWLECPRCSEKSTQEFIRKIIKSGHHSVLEHASASFRIVCDRGISHEIVRHRIASYSQESSRYCNYSNDKFGKEITVIKPRNIKSYASWEIAMREAEESYFRMLEVGDSPQIARSVLPTSLKTEIVMTTNFRSWRNFLKIRLDKAAHPDMIVVAKLICAELKKVAPTVFEEFQCEK